MAFEDVELKEGEYFSPEAEEEFSNGLEFGEREAHEDVEQ